ncbi:MAG: hypothetical protein K2N95_15785 [Lachnospiraceae bacterium]|nr:hypothetical protein [Lachnospiraceae bacterium]
MNQSILFNFFGGVSQDGFSWMVDFDKVLLELARWLLPIGICLLAEGVGIEKWRKIEPLSRCRYGTVKIWWRQKYRKSLLYGIFAAVVLWIAAIAADRINAVDFSDNIWKMFLLWFAHSMTIMSFFLILDLTKLRRLAPAILLLLEGVTFLVGFQSIEAARFMYGMWGMYFQSTWHYSETGVSVLSSLVMEGVLMVLGYLAGQMLLERTTQNEQE